MSNNALVNNENDSTTKNPGNSEESADSQNLAIDETGVNIDFDSLISSDSD